MRWVVSETRIHVEIEGNFCIDSSGISWRFPTGFIEIFGGLIGDNKWMVLRGILGDSQDKSWEICREIRGKFKGNCNISHLSLMFSVTCNLKFF